MGRHSTSCTNPSTIGASLSASYSSWIPSAIPEAHSRYAQRFHQKAASDCSRNETSEWPPSRCTFGEASCKGQGQEVMRRSWPLSLSHVSSRMYGTQLRKTVLVEGDS